MAEQPAGRRGRCEKLAHADLAAGGPKLVVPDRSKARGIDRHTPLPRNPRRTRPGRMLRRRLLALEPTSTRRLRPRRQSRLLQAQRPLDRGLIGVVGHGLTIGPRTRADAQQKSPYNLLFPDEAARESRKHPRLVQTAQSRNQYGPSSRGSSAGPMSRRARAEGWVPRTSRGMTALGRSDLPHAALGP